MFYHPPSKNKSEAPKSV